MSVAHPFHRTEITGNPSRSAAFTRRRQRPSSAGPTDGATTTAATGPARRVVGHEGVVPGTRTPAGVPRDLVVDETGRPRRSVLLAAIMIRRGRSVAEISAATGLAPDVVTCLSRSV